MKSLKDIFVVVLLLFMPVLSSCGGSGQETPSTQGNPYLPMWEHIPDGEPYVFEDPDRPGEYRAYIYGSHDTMITGYCGSDLVLWSASVDNLNEWRYEGEILRVLNNGAGEPLNEGGPGDVLYAPDVAEVTEADGSRMYYLFPNDMEHGRRSLVAKSRRPDGPFEVCNWCGDNPSHTYGILEFDPSVFVDDDGRVYGYWGFECSYAAELDPSTMCTLKEGTQIVENMISGSKSEGIFRFYEASSIRKIEDKYVLVYSRFTHEGEFGLPASNYTLAYAYSDAPLGPWTYGGTIIDGRGREIDEDGNAIATGTVTGNTHGGLCKIKDQWYVFYHRQTGTDEFARQAMVAPVTVRIESGKGGKVEISEGEYNSEGFSLGGLNPLEAHSAGIACWCTGPEKDVHIYPNTIHYGSYVASAYGMEDKYEHPYALRNNANPVVNNTSGSIVGYKYFNFDSTFGRKKLSMLLNLIPEGLDGTITVMADRPWTSQGGVELGRYELRADMPKAPFEAVIPLPALGGMKGKHAIYLKFSSDVQKQSICILNEIKFK